MISTSIFLVLPRVHSQGIRKRSDKEKDERGGEDWRKTNLRVLEVEL